jgi:hypothetical protein
MRARFVDANGNPLFGQFTIAAQSSSDAYAHVAVSNGGPDDVFLVTFSSELGGLRVYGRLVRYTPAGPEMSPIFQLQTSAAANVRQGAGGIAYDPVRRRFLATWEDYRLGAPQIFGRFVYSNDFSPAAPPTMSPAEQNLSATPYGQGTPNVAFDVEHNRYLVVFRGNAPDSPAVFGSWGRLLNEHGLIVDVDGDGTPTPSDVITLSRGGEPAEQFAVYLPQADTFLTLWAEVGGPAGGRDLHGKIVAWNGQPTTGVLALFATGANEGMPSGVYNAVNNKTLVVFARDSTRLIEGLELTSTGVPVATFGVGSVAPTNRSLESQFPSVAAAEDGRFGFGYLNDYSVTFFEVYHSTSAPGGSGTTSPPPPPPPAPGPTAPPPPSPTLPLADPSAASITGNGRQSLALQNVNTGQVAVWDLLDTTLVDGGMFQDTVAADLDWRIVGNGDLNRDGKRDFIWRNRRTGSIGLWYASGFTLLGADLLSQTVADTNWTVVSTKDANGDGWPDLLWQNQDTGAVAIWFMQGTQLLDGMAIGTVDRDWLIAGSADLNRDGSPEIVWQHRDGRLATWYMQNGRFVDGQLIGPVSGWDQNWRVRALCDINGDGYPDFVWQHTVYNWLAVTLMNGATIIDSVFLTPQMMPGSGWQIMGPR